jgi:hypothetical protein
MAAINNYAGRGPTPEVLHKIERAYVPLAKIASLVVSAVSLYFLITFPGFITFTLAATLCVAARDVFTMGNNLISLIKDPIRADRCDQERAYAVDEITKSSLIIGPILRIIDGFYA